MFTHIISRSNHWLTALFDEPEYGPQDAYGIRDTILLVATGFGLTAGAAAREKIRLEGGGYRREHLRALAQRVEVAEREVRIMGSKSNLLRTLTGVSLGKTPAISVPSSVLNWRRGSPPICSDFTNFFVQIYICPYLYPSLLGGRRCATSTAADPAGQILPISIAIPPGKPAA